MVICLNTQKYVWSLRGGGKISVHRFGGGAKTWRAIIKGGHVLSASGFRNSTAPPAVNNDHSLRVCTKVPIVHSQHVVYSAQKLKITENPDEPSGQKVPDTWF